MAIRIAVIPLPDGIWIMAHYASNLANIAASGSGLDLLPADQIAHARLSKLLRDVPEASTFARLALGLFGLGFIRRHAAFN